MTMTMKIKATIAERQEREATEIICGQQGNAGRMTEGDGQRS